MSTHKAQSPALYGLNKGNSNRDFSKRKTWGKNQFNTAFPVSLSCYLHACAFEELVEKLPRIHHLLNAELQNLLDVMSFCQQKRAYIIYERYSQIP